MKKILIADSCKASLVMTSELFKDRFSGIQVFTVQNLNEMLNTLKKDTNFDLFIIDISLLTQNAVKFVLNLKTVFRKPIILTVLENIAYDNEIYQKFKTVKKGFAFIQKPINTHVLQTLCDYYQNNQVSTFSELSESLAGFGEIYPPNSTVSSTKLKSRLFSIFIDECHLTSLKFTLYVHQEGQKSNHNLFTIKKSQLKNFSKNQKLKIYFPDPLQIGLAQYSQFKEKKADLLESNLLSQETLTEFFPFVLVGKIVSSKFCENENKMNICIEFENEFCAKQLFDAIMRSQTPTSSLSLSELYF